MYNREQRRTMEKRMGLYKQYQGMTAANQAEVRKKRLATGKQIHLSNLQEVEEKIESDRSERFAKSLQNLVAAGMEESAAEALLVKNIELEEKYQEKLLARANRQKLTRTTK